MTSSTNLAKSSSSNSYGYHLSYKPIPTFIAEERESYNQQAANDTSNVESQQTLSVADIEQLEQRFWTMATGPESVTRRGLLALLGKTPAQLDSDITEADQETIKALYLLAENSIETIECLKLFTRLLETAQQQLFESLDQLRD